MAYSLGQRYLAFVVQLVVTVVLARLLTPQETGIFSLAASTVAIGHLLREFGVADYLFAQKDVSNDKLRRAFTVTLVLAWVIAAVLWAFAGKLAEWYSEPGLKTTIHWLCLNFGLLPFGSIATALMARELRFRLLFWTQSSGVLVGGALTVALAWNGYSYLSMAIGAVATNLWSIGLLLLIQRRHVLLMPLFTGLGDVVRFGGATLSARVLEQMPLRGIDFIISASLGFHATGIYSKSSSLLGSFHEFFNSAVARVAQPAFASARHGGEDVHARYIQLTVLVASALGLFFPFLNIHAEQIVLLLFGPRWQECVPILQLASLLSLVSAPYMMGPSLLAAMGAVRAQLRMQLVSAPLALAAILVGAQVNLLTIVWLLAAATLVRLYMLDRALLAVCGIRSWSIVQQLGRTAAVCAVAAGSAFASQQALRSAQAPALATLFIDAVVMGLAAVLTAKVVKHPLYAETMAVLARLFKGRRAWA